MNDTSLELYLTAIVKKFNKRTYIKILETDEFYYTPPDFIYKRINARRMLEDVAERMNQVPYKDWFSVIFEFECSMSKRTK